MGKKGYDKYWKPLMNKNNMKFLFKRIPYEFYVHFVRNLCKVFGEDCLSYGYIDFDGTIGWGKALKATCDKYPQWQWIIDIQEPFNWIDYDTICALMSDHIIRLYKKGKIA